MALAVGAIVLIPRVIIRLRLSAAKHPSVRGHARMSRRIARLVPDFRYSSDAFFQTDDAPEEIAQQRRAALERLQAGASERSAHVLRASRELESQVSDVAFTARYRVPFPYRDGLPAALRYGSLAQETRGNQICDLDGQWRYDLSGSYGVNVFGYGFYKQCLAAGFERAKDLGPVLGPYHPDIQYNVAALRRISGLDEVSFHMSGTEAVMQAVRLARYHTRRSHLVRLCGSYHGWWDGVQPGVGNSRKVNDVYTLADLSDKTLAVLATRKDIACVLINPMQAMHPNRDAPGDSTLLSSSRSTDFERERYTVWLKKIRDICTRRGIVLIFDEVFTGFRLGLRGAQEYFGVQADMVTYGKTLGGGLPIGVLCGRHALMARFRPEQPANVCFARGTFNAHPYVMSSMRTFLAYAQSDEAGQCYAAADALWQARVSALNEQLAEQRLPIKLANMHSVITVLYTQPSRYNWMFQFYLREAGLELGWTGTGRLIMSLAYSDEEFAEIGRRLIAAATRMNQDGWWWPGAHLSNRWIVRRFALDVLRSKFALRAMRPPEQVAQVNGDLS